MACSVIAVVQPGSRCIQFARSNVRRTFGPGMAAAGFVYRLLRTCVIALTAAPPVVTIWPRSGLVPSHGALYGIKLRSLTHDRPI